MSERRQAGVMEVYLEAGAKRVFAGALDWPGWSRSGREEASAIEALCEHAERYRRVVASARLGFRVPEGPEALRVLERVRGDAGTDFGVPSVTPGADRAPVDDADLRRFVRILRACWRAFDRTVDLAEGVPLRKGPRGGGRDLAAIVAHVCDADGSYVRMLGTDVRIDAVGLTPLVAEREAVLEALSIVPRDEPDRPGPRGGRLWTPRYAVRRIAWHVLDHAWEIEDRMER